MAKKKKKSNAVAIGLIVLVIAVVIGGSMVALGVFNPTCEKASCSGDPKYTGTIKNKDEKCKDRKCASSADKTLCCQLKGTCDSVNCEGGYTKKVPLPQYCAGAACTQTECCSKIQAPAPSPAPSPGSGTISQILAKLRKGATEAACSELRHLCANATGLESAGCALGETFCS